MNDSASQTADEESNRLAENIMHFARVLRAAGLPVGPGRALEGVRAVIAAGVGSRQDFYWTLFSVFVNRQDHRVHLHRTQPRHLSG